MKKGIMPTGTPKLTCLPWRWVMNDHSRLGPWLLRARKLSLDGVNLMDGWLNDEGKVLYHLPRSAEAARTRCFGAENIRRVKSVLKNEGLAVCMLTAHNDFYCYTHSEQTAERDRMKVVLDVAEDLGCESVQLLTGPVANEKGSAEELIAVVADMIAMVLGDLQGHKQILAFENTPGVFRDAGTFRKLVEKIDHPQFGVNFDVKHVNGSSIEAARGIVASGKLFSAHVDNYLGENYLGKFPGNWDRNVALEKGLLDIPTLVSVIAQGRPQWITNEFAGEDITLVDRNIAYLRKLIG